jgi:hypothetical protein
MAYPVSSSPYSGSSPSPAYSGTFIPEVWSGKLVEKFYKATVLGAVANTDYEGEVKNFGDKVQIRSRPTVSIANYESNMDLAVQRPSVAKQTMNIDKGKYFNLHLDDVMEIQSDIDQMSIWAEDAAEQMKITIDDDVLNTGLVDSADIPAANKGNTAGAISSSYRLGTAAAPVYINKVTQGTGAGNDASNDRAVVDFIVDSGSVLDEQNIPETGRWMIIPAWMAGLIKQSDLKDASLSGDGTSILRNGRLGMIDRFTLYISNVLTADGTYSSSFPVLFGTKAGFSFASQVTKMETIRSERTFGNLLRGLQVYGYKVVNGVALGSAWVRRG